MTRPTEPIHFKTERTDSGCILHLQVPDDLYYLQGHFPQIPIVAGICQLRWVINAIEAYCGEKLHIVAMEAVKFHRILFPGQPFFMEITFDRAACKWGYRIYSEDKKFASGRLAVEV